MTKKQARKISNEIVAIRDVLRLLNFATHDGGPGVCFASLVNPYFSKSDKVEIERQIEKIRMRLVNRQIELEELLNSELCE